MKISVFHDSIPIGIAIVTVFITTERARESLDQLDAMSHAATRWRKQFLGGRR